ncbi:hypothetical protein EKH57_02400 [Halorubrum sp. BOL3-1]|uniref:hypothetical protein n=1 Tax=Halorubrum sp. BOL3-1 TaxID=2497325 RepID=UPI001005072A|nr:hypothetical protein [Halorubrum sp. BOL3-1]QAU11702.1 hypothetical protein EKH57_02400 [Halorubrum sp. BOL3-1]
MFDSLSGPTRFLVTRLALVAVGAAVGLGLYALGTGVALAMLLAFATLVIGEAYLFAVGDGV